LFPSSGAVATVDRVFDAVKRAAIADDIVEEKDEYWIEVHYRMILKCIVPKHNHNLFRLNHNGIKGCRLFDLLTCSDESLALYVYKLYADQENDGAEDDMSVTNETSDDNTATDGGVAMESQQEGSEESVAPEPCTQVSTNEVPVDKHYWDKKGHKRPIVQNKNIAQKRSKRVNSGKVEKEENIAYYSVMVGTIGSIRDIMKDDMKDGPQMAMLDTFVRNCYAVKQTNNQQEFKPVRVIKMKREWDFDDNSDVDEPSYMRCPDDPYIKSEEL
jgi:hypothetical protein